MEYEFLKEEEYRCYVDVELTDREENNILTADYLRYLPDKQYTYLKGSASLESPSNEMIIHSDIFERFEKDGILYAKGNLRLFAVDKKAYSAMSVYYLNDKKIILYGNPKIIEKNSTFFSEKVRYNVREKLFSMENQILGDIVP